MRHALMATALAATGILAAGAAAPAAMAADDCPNAAVRAQQMHASNLPNCFAYERVTPNDKNGTFIKVDNPITADGSAVSVWSTSQILDSDPAGMQQLGAAHRGPDGWTIGMLSNSSAWGTIRVGMTTDAAHWKALSGDFRTLLFRTNHPLAPGDLGRTAPTLAFSQTPDFYLSRPDGPLVWVTAPVSGQIPDGTVQAGSDPQLRAGSEDLSRIVFETTRVLDPAIDATVRSHVWLFQDGQPVEPVDRLPNGSLSDATEALSGPTAEPAAAATTSRDARRVVFRSSSLHGTLQVFARVDLGTPDARTVLVSADAAGTVCPVASTFDSITENGRFVRFSCAAKLTSDAPTAGGFYVRELDSGSVVFDEPAVDFGSAPVRSRVTTRWNRPEGTFRVENLGSGVNAQVHRTEIATGNSVCVSCPTDGSAPTAGSSASGGIGLAAAGGAGLSAFGSVTPTGEVVFTTAQRLVPEDTNTAADLYMWKNGRHYMLSSGSTGGDVQFGGVSLDGSTISFTTAASLVPGDQDGGARDAYVLRRDGGFLVSGAADECTSGCQGPASPPGAPIAPLSIGFSGAGNVEEQGDESIAVSGSRSVRGTSLRVKVRTPAAGRVVVSGSGLRATSKSVARASTATLTARLSARSQRTLLRKGTLKVRASVRFVSVDGSAQVKRVGLTFRKKAAKKSTKGKSRGVATAPNGKAAR